MTYSMIYEIGINQHYPKFTHSVPHVKLNPLPSHIMSLSLRDHVYTIYIVYTNVYIYNMIWIYIYTSTFKGVPIKTLRDGQLTPFRNHLAPPLKVPNVH